MMRTNGVRGLLAVALLVMAGCDRAEDHALGVGNRGAGAMDGEALASYAAAPAPPAKEAGSPSQSVPTLVAQQDAMLIRTGSVTIEVDSLETGVAAVRRLAESVGGYVTNSEAQVGAERTRRATLELRVPADRFDETLSGLDPIGRVEAVHVDAQDVGEEYVDVTARLANLRRLEERLIGLLASRTGDLEDVLAVERELARVREESERLQGRIRWLESRVATSTLTVRLHEPSPLFAGKPGHSVIGDAVRQAWRNFVGLIAGGIAALGFVLPLAAVAVLLAWAVRRLPRFRRRPRPAAQMVSNSDVEM